MKFVSKIREVGSSNMITIPKNIMELCVLENGKIYQFSVEKNESK